VATLTPAHVGLVGPLHEVEGGGISPNNGVAAAVYRSARTQSCPHTNVLEVA
jgi:hypothetical protein